MTVTWRSAFSYACTVVVLSWFVGALVSLSAELFSGDPGHWASSWSLDPWQAAFAPVATVSLVFARRLLPALPRWQVVVADAVVYFAVLLLTAVLSAWSVGDEALLDAAFVLAIISLFTLQLPAAWLLSLWRSGHLEVVLVQRGTAREAGKPAE
ncbi:hypothetical protein [Streptomyces sp. NPDC019507]|uniref:hypothetical protein n=1 Tax=Streptomyces sp. NPDC019507 TaxID=3154689 RepID=UPI0033F66555